MSGQASYQLYLFSETPRAWFVGKERGDRENDNSFWLPKSQCELIFEAKDKLGPFISVKIPDWLAKEKGLDASRDGEEFDDDGEGDILE